MSMFWDTTRAENGMACLQHEMWGIRRIRNYPSRAAEEVRQDSVIDQFGRFQGDALLVIS